MSFDSLGLSAELLRAVREQGYTESTPIQNKAIPVILQGLDIMACAQTGTGKTAGFTLPLLQRLAARQVDNPPRAIRALVLTPTRELAAQVGASIETYGRHLPFRSAVIFGGVKINPQIDKLRRGVDVLVATPGRLLDHAKQRTIDLSRVEILVLDEADRMLDMGFLPDIRRIMALLPDKTERQNLLFSATFSEEIRQLAGRLLNAPQLLEVAPRNATVELIEQLVHPVDQNRKRELLSHMIGAGNWRQVLVFMRTKHGANRLAKQLEQDGLSATPIHGNKSQAARTRALADFKRGTVRVLVATDIAARGLDIDQLPHVVNYEMPNVPEDYVHRIGRTGRAGKEGTAVSLVAPEENGMLRDIERLIRREIPRQVVPGYESSGRPGPAIRDTRNGRSRQNGQERQNGQTRQNGPSRQNGQARQGGQARTNGQNRQNGQARANGQTRQNGQGGQGGQARPEGSSPPRGQRSRREQPAVASGPNRGPAAKSAQAKPGFSPLSERRFVDWDAT
jgi:ATP-dependent RNA helicase RhlE